MTMDVLNNSVNEKDVENIYRHNFLRKFKDMIITSPYNCDGFGECKIPDSKEPIRVLMEYKHDKKLKNKLELCKILAQSIFYVKKFYNDGTKPPSTIFIADNDECLVIHVNDIIKYLDLNIDWLKAPSSASENIELLTKLKEDDNINPFVFDSKDFDKCLDKIKDLTGNVQRKVLITEKNITDVFYHFDEKVLGKSCKLTTNEKANLFVQLLVNRDENYLHPVNKRKTIVTKGFGELSIPDRDGFISFFNHFESSYSPTQKEKLTSIVDRLVEDVTRRKQGEFFTPTIWVDKAHEYITSVYGENWKDEYVVWDPAWGTGNLTRDYKFKELYVSTLNSSDIETAKQMGYNPEATKFQFDFLNDDYEFLPKGLRDAIEGGRKIIVLMNPPYATSNVAGNNSQHKKGVSKTKMNEMMVSEGWGKSSQNLYSQFYFRLTKLQEINKKIKIGVFCKPLYLTGDAYFEFRVKFFKNFGYEKGFLFEASNFSDVAKGWGINFAIFSENTNDIKTSFTHDLIEFGDDIDLVNYGVKNLYNTDGLKQASKWVREELKGLKTFDAPQISSATIVKEDGCGTIVNGALGYLLSNANNVGSNAQQVALFTGTCSKAHGLSVIDENFYKCLNLFTGRKLVSNDWINDKDEYFAPNENHEQYEQFTNDSIVYSLFNNSSQQSSLRQVTYKNKLWDIKNEFFWISKDIMKSLGDKHGYDELYNDVRTDSDRYVYKLLFGQERIYDKLSPDAKLVLDKATELVEKSMDVRKLISDDTNHLNSWDAGYAQLKLVWKEYFSDEFKEFRQLYKNMEDRMRPLVYELGFLIK